MRVFIKSPNLFTRIRSNKYNEMKNDLRLRTVADNEITQNGYFFKTRIFLLYLDLFSKLNKFESAAQQKTKGIEFSFTNEQQ